MGGTVRARLKPCPSDVGTYREPLAGPEVVEVEDALDVTVRVNDD